MIISSNRKPNLSEFQSLVDTATHRLNDDANKRGGYYLERGGQKLEDDVLGFLDDSARGTKFEGTIKKISGQKFPDIIAANFYGVEVKSSKDDKWISLGGSINESTRVSGVERIFLTFGKLTTPVEFRSRPYEDCLSEVVVTHYPRYKIDMRLSGGETIFNKMSTTYDDLRLSQDPVGRIVDYYKNQLAEGESLWWTGKAKPHEDLHGVPMKIRLMRTLSAVERKEILALALAYFPEIVGNTSTKYERYALWLAANQGIISTSTRDMFSACGQGAVKIHLESHAKPIIYEKIPRKIINIFENRMQIFNAILSTDECVLRETWRVNEIQPNKIKQWIRLVIQNSLITETTDNKGYNEKITMLLLSLHEGNSVAL